MIGKHALPSIPTTANKYIYIIPITYITSADGFIGSHLTEYLANNTEDKIRAFVYYNSFNSWDWIDTIPKETRDRIKIFAGDIRDPNGVH